MSKRWSIKARGPNRNLLTLTKKGFSTRGAAWTFGSFSDASKMGAKILRHNAGALSGFRVWIEPVGKTPVRKNPSGYARARDGMLAEIDAAADKFEEFTGFRATKETRYPTPRHKAGFALGALVGVIYEQNRKGDGLSQYRHDFKKNWRPQLVSSLDGSQLVIVGGQYRVSEETGINDEP